jgi:hypothetical protein
MAITAGDIYVRSGNQGAFTQVTYVQGGWITVASGSNMTSLDPTRLSDGQIVYVRSEDQTYVCNFFEAFVTPGYSGFSNSASFAEFNFPSTAGEGADITEVTAGDGLSGGASSGNAIVSLNTGSAHFISGAIDLAIFKQTGSYYSTTNNLHITGGLQLNASESGDVLSIFSASVKTVSINQQGVLQLISQSSTPTPVAGGLYLDTNYDLYIGQE